MKWKQGYLYAHSSLKVERRTKYAKRRARSNNYYRRHASDTPSGTSRLLNYALLPFLLQQHKPKAAECKFVTPIASCEGPQCTPSLLLFVPRQQRTVPSTSCSGITPRQQMGFTHRGMSQLLARPATGGRMSKRQSLSALSQSVHPRRQVDLWLRASLSFPRHSDRGVPSRHIISTHQAPPIGVD